MRTAIEEEDMVNGKSKVLEARDLEINELRERVRNLEERQRTNEVLKRFIIDAVLRIYRLRVIVVC